uniref:Uncharacterized protein n=1 Tax=Glossina pallidipes TaxID=7398 RepID=A0A1A9Z1G0_GLOPL
FRKNLENCASTTELVSLCFVKRWDTFYRLYLACCQNEHFSERLRGALVDMHVFLQECQKRSNYLVAGRLSIETYRTHKEISIYLFNIAWFSPILSKPNLRVGRSVVLEFTK